MNKSFLESDQTDDPPQRPSGEVVSLFAGVEGNDGARTDEPVFLSKTQPESMAETVRRSGLAYSAGVAFFASVVFMLVIGWGADLLFGSSPWGIVIGIVFGSIIGFVQFFRITSRIFGPETKSNEPTTLFQENNPKK